MRRLLTPLIPATESVVGKSSTTAFPWRRGLRHMRRMSSTHRRPTSSRCALVNTCCQYARMLLIHTKELLFYMPVDMHMRVCVCVYRKHSSRRSLSRRLKRRPQTRSATRSRYLDMHAYAFASHILKMHVNSFCLICDCLCTEDTCYFMPLNS